MKKERKHSGTALLFMRVLCIVLAVIAISFALRPPRGIVSFEKTGSEGNEDIYTVTYTDGTTSEIRFDRGSGGSGTGSGSTDTIDTVAAKALLSSMKIYTAFPVTETADGTTKLVRDLSSGSAVIYKMNSEDTYVITNYHVIYHAISDTEDKLFSEAYCYLYGSESGPTDTGTLDNLGYPVYDYGNMGLRATYVGGSAAADIAVLRLSSEELLALNPDACPMPVATAYRVGETVIAIGNTDSDGISVTRGIVSVDSEWVTLNVAGYASYRVLRTDAAIHFGNSGGALLNTEGKLIGITNGGSTINKNVNYALPMEAVLPVVENILAYATSAAPMPKKITLGVTVTADSSKAVYDAASGGIKIVETVKVVSVAAGSISAGMGLRADDVLTALHVNGNKVALDRYYNIGDILYSLRAGDEISFTFLRNGTELESASYTVSEATMNPVP